MNNTDREALRTIMKNQVLIMQELAHQCNHPHLKEKLFYQVGFTEMQVELYNNKPETT